MVVVVVWSKSSGGMGAFKNFLYEFCKYVLEFCFSVGSNIIALFLICW